MIEITITDGTLEIMIPVAVELLDDPPALGEYLAACWRTMVEVDR